MGKLRHRRSCAHCELSTAGSGWVAVRLLWWCGAAFSGVFAPTLRYACGRPWVAEATLTLQDGPGNQRHRFE